MAIETHPDDEPREVSLKRFLLACDIPKILAKMTPSVQSRVVLVTAAGIISGDVDDADGVLGILEDGFAEAVEQATGGALNHDMLRLKNVQLQSIAGGQPVEIAALWINPDSVIGVTYGDTRTPSPEEDE